MRTIGGVDCGNLHRNILAVDLEGLLIAQIGIELHHNTDLAAAVDIADQIALKPDKTADLDVLTDGHDLLLQHLLDGQAIGADAGLEGIDISGVLIQYDLRQGWRQTH